jgi:hypothetical protein
LDRLIPLTTGRMISLFPPWRRGFGMEWLLRPWHLTILAIASWMNREQQDAMQYLEAENAVLREKLGERRILLSDDQRRRLAVKGKQLGRRGLSRISTLFTPDTVLGWHRTIADDATESQVDRAYDRKSSGPLFKWQRITRLGAMTGSQGALKNVGFHIADNTARNVLREHGIEPVPRRGRHTNWKTFLRGHWHVRGSIDFTTTEVWTPFGMRTYYILIAMQMSTRRIQICRITPTPNAMWVQQVGRNLVDYIDGFLRDTFYLLLDRDTTFYALRGLFENSETEVLLLPPRSSNLNGHVERFMRSMKYECLNNMIFFGEASVRRALKEFAEHYHGERNHQGLGNDIITPGPEVGGTHRTIHRAKGWAACSATTTARPRSDAIELTRMPKTA